MKLKEFLEVLPPATEIVVIHAVLNTFIPETDYNTDWMIITVRAIRRNKIQVSVI